jgi:predicted  nucleic acid-binding Zn-ribbon protein
MPDIQEIWNRIEEAKREQREIKNIYKDMLASSEQYESLTEELKTLKAQKKMIETGVQDQMSEKWKQAELLQRAIVDDRELLADAALKYLLNGKTIQVKGLRDEEYEPLFAVRFRKKS